MGIEPTLLVEVDNILPGGSSCRAIEPCGFHSKPFPLMRTSAASAGRIDRGDRLAVERTARLDLPAT